MGKAVWLLLLLAAAAQAQTVNSWTNSAGGKWETPGNWSLGVAPALSQSSIQISNLVSKTITIDATTTNFPGTMTVSNVNVFTGLFNVNTLALANAGTNTPLHVLTTLAMGDPCVLTITNSALVVDGVGTFALQIDGSINFIDGSIVSTSSAANNLLLGYFSRGQMTIAGGSLSVNQGILCKFSNTLGTFTVNGGTNLFNFLGIGGATSSTGTLWMSGGYLNASNLLVGAIGVGKMVLSNGLVVTATPQVTGPTGSLTILGGAMNVSSNLQIAATPNTIGSVAILGGQLSVTNAGTTIGSNGVAQMTVSGGKFFARDVTVASGPGVGTLTIAGGTNALQGPLTIGNNNGTGTVWVTGGQLVITNTPATVGAGSGFIVDGSVTLTNGSSATMSNNMVVGHTGNGTMAVLGGSLTVSNLVVGDLGSSAGTITVAGGTASVVRSSLLMGSAANATGHVWVTGGFLSVTPGFTYIASNGSAHVTISNGQSRLRQAFVTVGSGAGTLTIAGGTNDISELLQIGAAGTGSGSLWVKGGLLRCAELANNVIGEAAGPAQATVSNATWQLSSLVVGEGFSNATVTVAGGTIISANVLNVGQSPTAVAAVWLLSGEITVTNKLFGTSEPSALIGRVGPGSVTVSNGTLRLHSLNLGVFASSRGTLTVAGGVVTATNLVIGGDSCIATSLVAVTSGSLFVTNAAGNATLEVRTGTLTLSSGLLVVDQVVITNPCARLIVSGGSFSFLAKNLTPAFDADGDGVPNGADPGPFDPTDAGNDPDGDGLTNLQEYQAGTNPTNSASFFGITGITRISTNVLVTWQTGANKTNALERTAGAAGSFSNNFTAIFTATNTVAGTTNYLDIGAATNVPAFYYRIRLVP